MKRYAVLVVAFIAAAVCVRLGIWQLQRLGERRARNDGLAARLAVPPLNLSLAEPAVLASDSLHFRRAVARGVFDFERQVVVLARSYQAAPGVHVVTPLRLPGGAAVLVERGWVPAPDGRTVELPPLREPDSALVEGVLMWPTQRIAVDSAGAAWPRYVRAARPAALQPAYPYPLHGLLLRRTEAPEGAPPPLRPVSLSALTSGPHLAYAIQWFAFAVIAVVGSVALYRKSVHEARGHGVGRVTGE